MRRISWGLGDQAVSSLTNFAIGVVVARSLGGEEFGVFTLAWVTYTMALNLARGLASDPLTVRFSDVSHASWQDAVRQAGSTALLTGGVTGALALVGGVAFGGPIGTAFVVLGFLLPPLMLQDCWRFAFFAAGRGGHALVNDLVWAAALVPAMLYASEHRSVSAYILAWGLSGTVAAAVGFVQARLLPKPGGTRAWLRQHRDLGVRFTAENLSTNASGQLRMYGVGAIAGLVEVGTIRGAELLVGPFLALLMGMNLVAVPEAARVLRRAPHRLSRFCLYLGGGQALAALAWGAGLLLLLPDEVGVRLLGSVWEPASALILPATLSVASAGFASGGAAGLRALGAARRSLRAQLVTSAAYLIGGLGGAAVGGALGSSWGVAAATLIGAVVRWAYLLAAVREIAPSPITQASR
ncbi:membrane protein [Pseudonocardia yuanmonensis]|uniref:Membrane protein n=1 Tax=Pseudonocardia yuanmonensis TaxID=1095914 RepID=A0ABP8VY49_9PSEU